MIPLKFNTKLLLTFVIFIAWIYFLLCLIGYSLPTNVLSKGTLKHKKNAFLFFPEGWGFFTRDPKEPNISIFTIKNRQIQKISMRNTDLRFVLGFSRIPRYHSMELTAVLKNIPETSWKTFKSSNIDSCILTMTKIYVVKNPFSKKTIEGDIIVMSQPPVPWAWSKNLKNITMPYKLIHLYVK